MKVNTMPKKLLFITALCLALNACEKAEIGEYYAEKTRAFCVFYGLGISFNTSLRNSFVNLKHSVIDHFKNVP